MNQQTQRSCHLFSFFFTSYYPTHAIICICLQAESLLHVSFTDNKCQHHKLHTNRQLTLYSKLIHKLLYPTLYTSFSILPYDTDNKSALNLLLIKCFLCSKRNRNNIANFTTSDTAVLQRRVWFGGVIFDKVLNGKESFLS